MCQEWFELFNKMKEEGGQAMTNEQREAMEICKEKIIQPFYNFPNPTSIELKDTDVEAIETALSLIKEQQEEIVKYKNMIEEHKKQLKKSGIYGYDYDLKID